MSTISPSSLPSPIATFVEATNAGDLDRIMRLFVEDALVNDQLRDYWGYNEIETWATRDIIDSQLTIQVVSAVEQYHHVVLTAAIDGNFDKRGLPDPLMLSFYFTSSASRITQLIILRNQLDI